MTPGDYPCNTACECRFCRYNQFGHCTDNYPCEKAEGYGENNNENKEDN